MSTKAGISKDIHFPGFLGKRCPRLKFSPSALVASLSSLAPTFWSALQVKFVLIIQMITTKNINFYQPYSELYAARNSINNVTDLSDLTKLKILDMEKWVDLKTIKSDAFLLQQRPPIVRLDQLPVPLPKVTDGNISRQSHC